MVLIIMGVSGAGKTTVGSVLARRLGWKFYDADDLHTGENKEKIKNGIPLTDEDRLPWLEALGELIRGLDAPSVIACSALRKSYRDKLAGSGRDVRFVYLGGDKELIRGRLERRKGHFAGAGILESQLQALEEPEDALWEDIGPDPETIADDIIGRLKLEAVSS
ncbi:MAG: gluconokinase [Candidatus Dadabacteria bacterium]|nr:MAG: gluconokinase [Candidatus Dadabacteria bacterium]